MVETNTTEHDVARELPLTETHYVVLLALTRAMHGYAIMKHVAEVTAGRVQLGAGTLYGALKALQRKKWIAEQPSGEPRRREYRLTDLGRRVLQAEYDRLVQLAQIGAKHLGVTEEGGATTQEEKR